MTERLRVMSVIDELRIGGAERLLVDALTHISRDDVQPSLVLLHEHEHEPALMREFPPDIEVIRLRAPKTKGLDLLPALTRHVRRVRPHIVHTHLFRSNVWGGVAAHAGRALHLWTEHAAILAPSDALANDEMQNRRRHLLPRKVLAALGTEFLAVSDFVAQTVSAVAGLSPTKFHVVYNGVDLATFQACSGDSVRRMLNIPQHAVLLGMCGRFVGWKGVVLFANAARLALQQHPDARVLMVGDGPERAAIERELAPVKDRVHLVGYQSRVAEYVAAMDVFVAPSPLDTLGIVLYEAMLLGRACLVVKSGSAADPWFANAPVQFSPPAGRPEELAANMMRLARDCQLRERLGAEAVRYGNERFAIQRTVREYVAVYRSLVERR